MLHTVNKSPTEKSSLLSCLRLAQSGSDILLIEDGVYAAMSGTDSELVIRNALDNHRIYVLEPGFPMSRIAKVSIDSRNRDS